MRPLKCPTAAAERNQHDSNSVSTLPAAAATLPTYLSKYLASTFLGKYLARKEGTYLPK